jgi:hypothetical protein
MLRITVSTKCAWCGRIKAAREWLFERRQVWNGYKLATCPHCRLLFSLADSNHLSLR